MSDPGANPFAKYAAAPAPSANPFAKYAAPATGQSNTAEALGIPEDKGGFKQALLHGASFGLSDELMSGISAPVEYGLDALTGKKPANATLGDYYDANLDNIRHGEETYASEHPVLNTVANLGGGLMDFDPEAAIASVSKGFWPVVKQGTATGGAMGAVGGFGDAQGGFGNRLKGALIGGGFGAAAGGAAPVVIPWAIGGVREMGGMITKAIAPWTSDLNDFISTTAGHVLNSAAGPDGAHFAKAPLAGMSPTTGQITNNPGLKWLERSVEQSGPDQAAAFSAAKTSNNKAIHSAIGQLGDLTSDAPQAMSDAIERASNAAKTSTRAAWKEAGIDQTTGISAPQLQEHVSDYVGGLTIAARKNIPIDILDTLDQLADGGTTNLGEIQDLRSNVTDALRDAARSGQGNKARILGGLADTISDFIDNIPRPQDAAEAYDTARDATKQMKQTFTQPAAVRNVLGVDRYGADKTPLSAVADTYIRSGKGAPEAFQSYLDAVDSQLKSAARPGQTAPERIAAVTEAKQNVADGYQAARDAFAQRFLDKVQNTDVDQAGSHFISPAKVSNFLDDHAHIVNSEIFDDDQRDLINRIGQAADMSNRVVTAGAKGGSDTYAKLAGKTFLDVLIGPGASKIIPAAGAIVGAHTGGPVGAGVGFAAAAAGESKIENLLYGATRDKVLTLVHQAMSDPALAKTLMTQATAKTALQIAAPQRRMIYSILGAQASKPVADLVANTQGQNSDTP